MVPLARVRYSPMTFQAESSAATGLSERSKLTLSTTHTVGMVCGPDHIAEDGLAIWVLAFRSNTLSDETVDRIGIKSRVPRLRDAQRIRSDR